MDCGKLDWCIGPGGVQKVRCGCGWVTATIDGPVADWAALEAKMTAAHGDGWPPGERQEIDTSVGASNK